MFIQLRIMLEFLTNIELSNFVYNGNNDEVFDKHEINNIGGFD